MVCSVVLQLFLQHEIYMLIVSITQQECVIHSAAASVSVISHVYNRDTQDGHLQTLPSPSLSLMSCVMESGLFSTGALLPWTNH